MPTLLKVSRGTLFPTPDNTEDEPWLPSCIVGPTYLLIDGDTITEFDFLDGFILTYEKYRFTVDTDSVFEEIPYRRITIVLLTLKCRLIEYRDDIRGFYYSKLYHPVRTSFQHCFRKDHVADTDLWMLFMYLAKKILPAIKRFRNSKDCFDIPNRVFQYFLPFTGYTDYSEELEDEAEEKWKSIMDEMIFAFRWILERNTPQEEAFFQEYYGEYSTFETDRAANLSLTKKAEDRAQEGLHYFAEHFTDLWD